MTLKAPFPWFGGKSRAAHLVWAGFGDVANYVEPFAGSLAVLLGRPSSPRIETVNDLDCYVANFWRALKFSPDAVAEAADWPVNEADLHARHRWLVDQADFRKRMHREPKFFDPLIAGWWVWGICQWIGGGWCAASNWAPTDEKYPSDNATAEQHRRPGLHSSIGVHRRELPQKLPLIGGTRGTGVHRRQIQTAEVEGRPTLTRGKGVQQLPMLSGDSGASGRGIHASARGSAIQDWMGELASRLRKVRVCCGDWSRVLGRSATETIGVTGVLLDPPYGAGADRDPGLYAAESLTVAAEVRDWAIENGKNPKLRIALCGYEGEHTMPREWECVAWKAAGGYAASAGNTENSARERIWFSPACASVGRQHEMFGATQ